MCRMDGKLTQFNYSAKSAIVVFASKWKQCRTDQRRWSCPNKLRHLVPPQPITAPFVWWTKKHHHRRSRARKALCFWLNFFSCPFHSSFIASLLWYIIKKSVELKEVEREYQCIVLRATVDETGAMCVYVCARARGWKSNERIKWHINTTPTSRDHYY